MPENAVGSIPSPTRRGISTCRHSSRFTCPPTAFTVAVLTWCCCTSTRRRSTHPCVGSRACLLIRGRCFSRISTADPREVDPQAQGGDQEDRYRKHRA